MADFLDALCAHTDSELQSSASADEPGYCCVLGSGNCGKSTLLSSVLAGKVSSPLPATLGLGYHTLRCPAGSSPLRREVVNVFEVGGEAGGGTAEWLAIPLTPQRLPACAVVVVLDCGRPLELCATAVRVFGAIRRRVEECCERLARAAAKGGSGSASGAASPEALASQALARVALGYAQREGQVVAQQLPVPGTPLQGLPPHPDSATLLRQGGAHPTLLPLPTLLVGARWDLAREAPQAAQRALLAALRFLALAHGAGLVLTSHRDRASLGAFKGALLSATFGLEGRRQASWTAEPVQAPPGVDTLAELLQHAGEALGAGCSAAELGSTDRPLEARLQGLAQAIASALPQGWGGEGSSSSSSRAGEGGEEDLALTDPEPAIDALVAAKESAASAAKEARERERRQGAAEKRALAAAAGGGAEKLATG
jgi:hypothetical protein